MGFLQINQELVLSCKLGCFVIRIVLQMLLVQRKIGPKKGRRV